MVAMLFVIATVSRRIAEVGLLIGAVGALLVAWGAFSFLRAGRRGGTFSRTRERQATGIGAALVALGFVAQFYSMLAAGK